MTATGTYDTVINNRVHLLFTHRRVFRKARFVDEPRYDPDTPNDQGHENLRRRPSELDASPRQSHSTRARRAHDEGVPSTSHVRQ